MSVSDAGGRIGVLFTLLVAGLGLAVSAFAVWLGMAVDGGDVEASESPLLLAAARQLEHPGELYGPYRAGHRLVLIHAPFYYRVTLGAAWVWRHVIPDPVRATMLAGRALSGLSALAVLAAIARLARLGTGSHRAGLLAVLLFAATPIQGGLVLEVRPDMLGLACTLWGTLLVLESALGPIARGRIAGFALLGLACVIKQQHAYSLVLLGFVVGLIVLERRGRLAWVPGGVIAALGLAATVYAIEQWATSGNLWRSAFVAASHVSEVHPATPGAALNLLGALAWKNCGLLLVTAAVSLSAVEPASGTGRRLPPIGRGLIVVAAILVGLQARAPGPLVAGCLLGLLGLIVLLTLTAWVRVLPEDGRTGDVDRVLLMLCSGELGLTAALAWRSTGAWFNYALLAEAYACVLAASVIWRTLLAREAIVRPSFALIAALAATGIFAYTDAWEVKGKRVLERTLAARILEAAGDRRERVYFAESPGANRVFGRADLVHDPWLYSVFEAIGLADPRSIWLKQALGDGTIAIVATRLETAVIEGGIDLDALGFQRVGRVGPWVLWKRSETRGQARIRALRRPVGGRAPDMLHS